MLKNKQSEFSLIALLALLFGSALVVGAVAFNSTDNSSINFTINESILINLSNISAIENTTSINESTNLTIPIINETLENQFIISNETIDTTISIEINQSINQTLNETINITLPKKTKNLSEIVEKNKNKLNEETEKYLKDIKNKKEEKDFIVKFKSSIDEGKLADVKLDKRIDEFKLTKIKAKIEDIENLIEDEEIEFIELEQDVNVLGGNVPFNVQRVKADSSWNSSKGFNVKVAVLDTGISEHDDLAIAGGVSFVDNSYFDSNGHGTSVAGVIAALLNTEGLVGVAPEVSLYSVKIMQGSTGDLSNAIAGIEWAIDNNMSLVSMSFGFDSYSQIFKEVLQDAYNHNILLIAASGNNGQDNILYPAKYDTVIAVGATNSNDYLASFSSYGFEQELVAPGVDINSTSLGNSYSISSGTSLAAPHVAGVAALIKALNNSLTNKQIRAKLRNDALDLGSAGKDDLYGYGLVQVKLNTTNYTFVKETYYYEIYNITDYFNSKEHTLWKSTNGTVDDVNFANGYYWVKIYRNNNEYKYLYKIIENSTIKLLSASAVLHDDFKLDSSSTTDGKVWFGGVLKVHNKDPEAGLDAECFDYDSRLSSTPDFDECRYKNTTAKTDCATFSSSFGTTSSFRAFYQVCNEGGPGDICTEGGLSTNHTISNTSQQLFPRYAEVVSYHYCASAQDQIATSDSPSYYVFDQKQAVCSGTSSYNIQGRGSITGNPPSDDWVNYGTTQSCPTGTTCNADFAGQVVKFRNQVVPNPCVSLCSGSIYAVSIDSKGRPRENDIIKVNNIQNGTTNNNGEHKINFTNVACGLKYNISAYCSHNASKLCNPSQKQSSLDFQNDNDTLIFDCNVCSNNSDLFISLSDIRLKQFSGNIYSINVTIHSENIGGNVNVTVKGQNKNTGLIEKENSTIITISSTDTLNSTIVNLDTRNIDYLNVYVSTDVAEPKSNNYVLRPFIRKPIPAYLEVKTGNDKADQAIQAYLELFIVKQDSPSSNYLNIIIGRKGNTFPTINSYTQNPSRMQNTYFFDGKSIKYNNNYIGYTPYIGVVGGFWHKDDFGKRYVVAYGKELEGDIAAVKKLISAQSLFLTEGSSSYNERTVIIDNFDITGISVMDLFHNVENKPFYNNRGSNNFKLVVERILNDNNFELSIKTVKTTDGTSYGQNTTLRLKNVNTDYSTNFKDAIVKNAKPVALARGVWNNILTWESFGKELASDPENARDTWLIELTGGPTQDCDTCPNYKYEDLVDYYWPALIAGVEKYSGQNKLDYVGFSNGCRVAVDSLKNWSAGKNNAGYYFDTTSGNYQLMDLATNPVDIFVGVACPGAFVGSSPIKLLFNSTGNNIINKLNNKKINHTTISELILNGFILPSGISISLFSDGKDRISTNLLIQYNNWANNNTDQQPGSGLNLNKFVLIQGDDDSLVPQFGIIGNIPDSSDMAVTVDDQKSIYNNINSGSKKRINIRLNHHLLPGSSLTQYFIKKSVNNQSFNFFDNLFVVESSGG